MDDVLRIGIALVGVYMGMSVGQRLRRKRRSNEEATAVAKDTSFFKYLNDFGAGVLIGVAIFTVLYGEPTTLITFEPISWLRLLSEVIILSVVAGSVSFQLHRLVNRKP